MVGNAHKCRKKSPKKDAAAGANPVSFTVTIVCDPTQLLETSTTAHDCQFSFQFPGENNPDITPPVSQWNEKEWKKDFLRNADKDFLLQLEQDGSLVFNVEEKSCAFSMDADREASTPKSGKKGKSKKPPPKPVDQQPGEDMPIVRPDELDEMDFSRVMTFRLQLNSFLIDSNPVSRAFDQNIPNGQPLPPPSLQSFKVIVTADTKVMTEKFVKELLPMQLTIIGSEGVPAKPFPFSKMPHYYSPVYASYKFFNKRLAVPEEEEPAKAKKPKTQDKKGKKEDPKKGKKNAPPEPEPEVEEDKDPLAFEEDEPPAPPPPKEEIPVRKVSTDGLPHGPRMSWEHSEVFFLGLLDLEALASHFEQNPLRVELHDRDISKEGLKKAAIMSRGDKLSIARMLMVSPEDDMVSEQKEEVKNKPEDTPPQSAKGSRKKGDKKKKNSARQTDSTEKKRVDPSQSAVEQKQMEAVAKKKHSRNKFVQNG